MPGRTLCLDYGEKRIGVAVSDETGTIAQPLTVIFRKNRRHDLAALSELAARYRPERIVIGYPVRLDGAEGIQCEKVNRFAALLSAHLQVSIELWDESLTTREAEEILRRSGLKREKRKDSVDKIAASIILQNYLNALSSGRTA
ncbi:MAG TPA: Holliday junction resolvase RuvX [Syntrophales bacterium]|nr:Holliday junction resolvase RuvX [Syntrophales bacterium]HQG34116.1 Holliday junction resolvase RuvX [Syntrophales bacterium]